MSDASPVRRKVTFAFRLSPWLSRRRDAGAPDYLAPALELGARESPCWHTTPVIIAATGGRLKYVYYQLVIMFSSAIRSFRDAQPGACAQSARRYLRDGGAVDAKINRRKSARLRRALVEFSALTLAAMLPAAGPLVAAALALLLLAAAARHRAGAADIRVGPALAVAGGKHDLELVQLVPLGVSPLPFGNRLQLLQAGAWRYWFGIAHIAIISFFLRPLRRPAGPAPPHCQIMEPSRRPHGRQLPA